MKNYLLLLLLGLALMNTACQNESASKEENSAETVQAQDQDLNFLDDYLSDSEIAALQKVNTAFQSGLLDEYQNQSLPAAYELLALGLRMELFAQEEGRPGGLYPFKGSFDQEVFRAAVADLDFFTQRCGFQLPDDSVINYYCLKAESPFIDFYLEGPGENELIRNLLEDYQKNKALTPTFKNMILMESKDGFDFNKPSDQFFFQMALILIQEETLAYKASLAANNENIAN